MIQCAGWRHSGWGPAGQHVEKKSLATEARPQTFRRVEMEDAAVPAARLRGVNFRLSPRLCCPSWSWVCEIPWCPFNKPPVPLSYFEWSLFLETGSHWWRSRWYREGLLCLTPSDFTPSQLPLSPAISSGFPDNHSSFQEQTFWCNDLNLLRYSYKELIELNMH